MILLHEHTRQHVQDTLAAAAHGILLTGPEGAGKAYAARYFALKKLGLASFDQLALYPYLEIIRPEGTAIGIEPIRQLQKFLHLKTPGEATIRRIAIIQDAHFMTNEAQNALLKTLEEPPADTVLVLTSPLTQALKATIYSRVQQIPILPVTLSQAQAYFAASHDAAAIGKAHAISRGHAGLMSALLAADDHVLLIEIKRAKTMLAAPLFERLTQIDELSKHKENLPLFLQALKLISSAALHAAAAKENQKMLRHWHRTLHAIYFAEAALPKNPNAKLLLTDLVLHV